ncbi:RusA family crossover junction endodeoxyribonuclease [Deinococcus aestuarii]|uniref:RusA family crossover junction endodeoxyribonuclease n=1 Tax=Deinococcus aestuarii TaxID=2774531 RepID=UPI001C0E4FD0|nr:RusA family crossover junction endodeoxyribonuclease [Deinococcus aestuarii]
MTRRAKTPSTPASAPPEPVTFVVPALVTWGRSGGRPDPTAPRRAKLVGYYTRGATPNHTRLREYLAWKDHVRAHAPPALRRLRPVDEASRVRLDVVCYFANRTHADPENVRKALVDALFPGGDKWVYGAHDHPRYDAARPRVEVTVTLFAGAAAVKARPSPSAPEAAPVPPKKETPPRPVTPAVTARQGKTAQPPKKTPPTPSGRADTGRGTQKGAGKKTPAPPRRPGLWETLEAWAARLSGQPERETGRPGTRRK